MADKHSMPKLYHRIHDHLVAKGMKSDHAWAVAVNAVRKGCLSGDLNFSGLQGMSKPKRAEWCAAYSEWKANHPGKSAKSMVR